jgi:hypothetical protein
LNNKFLKLSRRKDMTDSTTLKPISHADLDRFKSEIRGDVIQPSDATYDEARQMHNPLHDAYPALIVRPRDADDVVCAVRFASERGLTIAVRGGGHNNGGFSTVNGGLVIDMCLMHAITVDPEARVARAEAGIRAGEYTRAVIAHGLITPFGDSPDVGVGGITTGGGVGWLTRKLGMTIDSLIAAEMVTADGRKLRVSETEHPDLFWAIRGGGGNFGVVTLFEFRLHPIGTVLGGSLYYPATRDIVRSIIDLSREAPDELTTITMIAYAFPDPNVPQELHGKLSVIVMPVWMGDLMAGQKALEPFRALKPLFDNIHPMPFIEMYEAGGAPEGQYTSVARALLAHDLDDAAIDAMLLSMEKTRLPSTSSMAVNQFRVLGGAMARVPADATAFAHRDAAVLVAIGIVGFEPAEVDVHQKWAQDTFEAMRHVSTGPYLNFLEKEGEERIREAYPQATYQRLAEVKRRYDPQNLFHLNQNIIPAKA